MLDVLVRLVGIPIGGQLAVLADFYLGLGAGDVVRNLIARLITPFGFQGELVGCRGVAFFRFHFHLVVFQRVLQRFVLGEPGNIFAMAGDVFGVAVVERGNLLFLALEQQ